jgi:urea transport system ATP-binding protein
MSESQIARAGVGRKFQRPTVFETQSVRDNLMMALSGDRLSVRRARYRPSGEDGDGIEALAEEIGLSGELERTPASSRTGRSNGSKSACCWHRIRSCCWSTSRRPG